MKYLFFSCFYLVIWLVLTPLYIYYLLEGKKEYKKEKIIQAQCSNKDSILQEKLAELSQLILKYGGFSEEVRRYCQDTAKIFSDNGEEFLSLASTLILLARNCSIEDMDSSIGI